MTHTAIIKTFQVSRLGSVQEFLELAGPLLQAAEAENHMMLGLCGELARSDPATISPVLLHVTEDGQSVAAALRTPPRKLVLTGGPPAALERLAEYAALHQADLPGVHGPGESAAIFARHFARASGRREQQGMTQRAFQCRRVVQERVSPGQLRAASEDDAPILLDWTAAFTRECGLPKEDLRPLVTRKLARGEIFVWDDGGPVCTASTAGHTDDLARVALVYTPPELRGRGYASSCVAALTRQVFDSGLRCFLYTDVANSVSNHVYEQIGYEAVCDCQNWSFE